MRRVSEAGGVATDVTALDPAQQETYHTSAYFSARWPAFCLFPCRRCNRKAGHFCRLAGCQARGSEPGAPGSQLVRRRLGAFRQGAGGHLFFLRDGTLMAQPFDAGRLKLTGEPVPVAEHVGTTGANGFFSVSANGSLAYRAGGSTANVNSPGLTGKGSSPRQRLSLAAYRDLSLSPDGTRAAILRGPWHGSDIWLHDFTRGVSTRFTFDRICWRHGGKGPVWSPDGTRIAFSSVRGAFSICLKNLQAEPAMKRSSSIRIPTRAPDDWSRDGRFLLYSEDNPKTILDLMVLPLEGNDRKPVPLGEHHVGRGARELLAGHSLVRLCLRTESGRNEVYVQPFTPPGSGSAPAAGKWQISQDGGTRPKWRADGKELIFRAPNGSPMAVEITTSPAFQAGIPKPLFTLPPNAGAWDVTADGKRFLVVMPFQSQQNARTPITVVLNWEAGLKK